MYKAMVPSIHMRPPRIIREASSLLAAWKAAKSLAVRNTRQASTSSGMLSKTEIRPSLITTAEPMLSSSARNPTVALIHPWVPFISSRRSELSFNISAVELSRLYSSSAGFGVSAAFMGDSFHGSAWNSALCGGRRATPFLSLLVFSGALLPSWQYPSASRLIFQNTFHENTAWVIIY